MTRYYFDVTVRFSGVVEADDEESARAAWREEITIDTDEHHSQIETEIIEMERAAEG